MKEGVVVIVMLVLLFSLSFIAAGDIIVKEGSLNIGNNLNSSNFLFVNSTRMGIGTATPTSTLTVNSSSATSTEFIGATQSFIKLTIAGSNSLYFGTASYGNGAFRVLNSAGSVALLTITQTGTTLLGESGAKVGIGGIYSPDSLLTINQSAKAMNVSGMLYVSSTNVGIGTSTPTATLNVVGNVNITNGLNVSNGLNVLSGRVGIGTTMPESILHIYSSIANMTLEGSRSKIIMSGTGGGDTNIISFTTSGAEKFKIQHDNTNNRFSITDNNSDGMYLYNKKIGIGTSAPGYPLTISSNYSEISIWAQANISAAGYITRTFVWDNEKYGNALDWIKNSSSLINNGEINHKAYSPEEYVSYTKTIQNGYKLVNGEEVPIYINITEEGILLDAQIAKHEQAIYDLMQENNMLKLELCKKDNTYGWC